LLIDHIVNMHVHACELSSPAPSVNPRSLSASSSLSSYLDTKVGPSPSASTPPAQIVSLPNSRTIDREGHDDTSHDGRNSTYSTFPYIHMADTTVYLHPIAQRCLPPTPLGVNSQVNFQSIADQRHEDEQSGQPEHS
jgi:hypothetical protein